MPAAMLIQRYPVAKFFSFTVLVWAIMMLCTAATQNFAGLATVRFLMGMAESVIFPVSAIMTVMWYSNSEQVVRLAFWNNQVPTYPDIFVKQFHCERLANWDSSHLYLLALFRME